MLRLNMRLIWLNSGFPELPRPYLLNVNIPNLPSPTAHREAETAKAHRG